MSYITLAPLSPGGFDPELAPTPCEYPGCPNAPAMRDCHSLILVVRHVSVDKGGHAAVQCENEQHWGCCHDHATAIAHACLDSHHEDVTARDYASHKNPARLLANRLCSHPDCGEELTGEGYHVDVTYAMCGPPLETLPDGTVKHKGYRGTHYSEVAGGEYWGCSLEHAIALGHSIIEHIMPHVPHEE